ncbi:hypothetical protein METP3_00957 [Methanosarcinales archaeon]|nr:hypothetical protein METP3_00957 [Methanosarcinales archaeon]
MKYTIGDAVRFKLESGEVQEGKIQYVEKSSYEESKGRFLPIFFWTD